MNERRVPAAPAAYDSEHDEKRPTGPSAVSPGPSTVQRSGWTGGRVAALLVGALLALPSLVLLGGGGTALWADRAQREAGYLTSDVHEFSASGSALATVSSELGTTGTGWLYSPSLLDKVRIQVEPVSGGPELFVGIGPSGEVDRYLADVSRTVISDFWTERVRDLDGGTSPSAPGQQDFWVASSLGPGPRSLEWEPTNGSWTVVVMNADGQPGIDVRADLGATAPALPWIAVGVLGAGVVFLVGGVLLIAGAVRHVRTSRAKTASARPDITTRP